MISNLDDVNMEVAKTHDRFRTILGIVESLTTVDQRTDSQIAGLEDMIGLLNERIIMTEKKIDQLELFVSVLGITLLGACFATFVMMVVIAIMFSGVL